MLRPSRYLTLAVFGAVLLAQPALAQAHPDRQHDRPHHRAAAGYPHRPAAAIIGEVWTSPFYGPFGGYPEAAAASHYFGPNARHYFGFNPEGYVAWF